MKLNKYLIIVVSFLIVSFTSCKQANVDKQIGIQLWSVRKDMKADPVSTIAKLGEMGYHFVEPAGYSDGKFYDMSPAEFKTLVETNGMTVKSSHTGKHLPRTENSWGKTMKWWDECIAAHKAVGAKYIIKPSMGGSAYKDLDVLKKYCEYYNSIGEKCNQAGIRFGYHNHANEFTTELEGEIVYDYLLKNTDPEKVTFELDLYWIYKGGKSAVEYFQKYPGRFELFHVKDEAELGASGKIDFKTAFDNAKLAGMKDYVVEVERYNYEPLESVAKSFEFLNNAEFVKK